MSLFRNIKNEPLAAIALLVTILLSVVQSDWFENLISPKVEIDAYYVLSRDGRCSLLALSVNNVTDSQATDIRINILTDYLVRNGKESIEIGSRSEMLIGAGEVMPLAFREELNIEHETSDHLIAIPSLLPGEYVDLFLARAVKSEFDVARNKLVEEDRYKNTPRIGTAAYKDGSIKINQHGGCLANSG